MYTPNIIRFLTDLYDKLYRSGVYPWCWSMVCIRPIFKKGDELDVIMLPVMGKIFSTILKERMIHNLALDGTELLTQYLFVAFLAIRNNHPTSK